MEKNPYEIDFEEYIRHTDASKKDKTLAWSTAIGLQLVDGLKPSSYLYETAKKNIEGELSFDEAKNLIDSYYESRTARNQDDERTEEADKVSSRIAQILSEPSFNFSPSHLIAIHKRLFEGIFKFAGKIRDYDITKKEWVLNGDTVMYGASFELKAALDYDFEMERNFKYTGLSTDEIIKHITFFVSRLWQIHAFGEGNTRTTAVFTIKYLRSMGYKVDNDIFAQNSWYFRNALVRANYKNLKEGIEEIFGYPGGVVLPLYDALYMQNEIKHYLVRHEQAAVHAAEGYARVSGKPGVAIVTSGPGACNTITGLANAYYDGTPLILITFLSPLAIIFEGSE